MHAYDVALFVHLLALFVAFGITGMLWFALARIRSARVCGEALQWLAVGKTAGMMFPVVLLTLLATGAYMVHDSWTWSTPWVDAGLTGVVFLGLVGDRVEGGQARKIAQVLAVDPGAPIEERAAAALRNPWFWSAAIVNPLIATAVAFDMVVKPGPIGAGAALAVALGVGCAAAVPLWRVRPVQAPAAVTGPMSTRG
jgi:hypothetical protein